jgi:hypothetical protein
VCTRNSENIDKDKVEEWLQSDACELGFHHMIGKDTVNAAAKQKGEEGSGEDDSEEEGKSSEHVSHNTALQCVDITAARKIQATIINYFSK